MKRTVFWTLSLAITWWLWSAHTAGLIIAFGVGSLAITLYFMGRMDRFADVHPPYELGLRPVWYLPYIVWEIIKANLDVAKIIISPTVKIQPKIIRVKASQRTIVGQVIYANSITLTPGTITCDMRDGEFVIHALTDDSAAGVESGDMDKRCCRLEGAQS